MNATQLERLIEDIAAGLQPFTREARRTADRARAGAEAYTLARELAPLLQDSRRATLTVRCPKGRPVYRVFEISGRLLGVPASDVWIGSGDGVWTLTPDWLSRGAVDTPEWLEGRCDCCDRPHRLALTAILGAIEGEKRNYKIRAVGS
jgi:hypothetical protein